MTTESVLKLRGMFIDSEAMLETKSFVKTHKINYHDSETPTD